MPRAPLRVCATHGCPNRVTHGHCPQHQRAQGAHRRATVAKVPGFYGRPVDFYKSPAWTKLSAQVRQDEPLCRLCGRVSEQADHIIPREDGGLDTRDNIQALCHSCHSAKTRGEMNRRRMTGGVVRSV